MLSEEWGLEAIPTDFFFRLFPVFLFLHSNSYPCPCPGCYSLVSRAPWEEKKGQSDTGGNSQPCHIRGPARPLPQSLGVPGLPCSSFSPSGPLVSRSGCQKGFGLGSKLAPCHPGRGNRLASLVPSLREADPHNWSVS